MVRKVIYLRNGLIFLAMLIFFSVSSCEKKGVKDEEVQRDLADILADGKLVAVTDYNATSYFIYKGEPMGYQYDMLRDLAT